MRLSFLFFFLFAFGVSSAQTGATSTLYVFPYKVSKLMRSQDESALVFINGTQLTGMHMYNVIKYTIYSPGKLYVTLKYFDASRTIEVEMKDKETVCVGLNVDSKGKFMGVTYWTSLEAVNYETMSRHLATVKEDYTYREFDENDIAMQKDGESVGRAIMDGTGTGFFVTNSGLIMTNYHVVEEASKVMVKGVGGNFDRAVGAEIVAEDKEHDLAILRLNDSTIKPDALPFVIRDSAVETGEELFTLGYPTGKEIKPTTGVVSTLTGYHGNMANYQVSTPAQSSNNGSPVFDKSGNLIGVAFSKVSVLYAVKAEYVKSLVCKAEANNQPVTISQLKGIPLSEQVKKLSPHIFIIEVSKKSSH